jgi:hypothetical protein
MTSGRSNEDRWLERLPSLANRIRTAVLLRPRQADSLAPATSKFGGRILWPAAEPWPDSEEFDDVYVAVLQLSATEFPEVELPAGKDLLQLLWCPHYSFRTGLAPRVYLRCAKDISDPLPTMPMSRHREEYVPAECRLEAVRIQELPPLGEFEPDELDALDEDEQLLYKRSGSVAKCSKLGGYVAWIQEPDVPSCQCGADMEYYLTIASASRGSRDGRCGYEDTGLGILDEGAMYCFVCRRCEPWTFSCVFQGA